MIVSLDWLKEFVDIQESPDELAELLSGIGLEAEVTSVPTEIPGVVIGKVESAEKHPDADKLKLCTVNDGKQVHQVVCGAPNVDAGQTIAFATVGSVLPGNLKIKKAKIRGVESSGMICSERELNLSDEHEGIMVLPDDLEAGTDFVSSYGYKYISVELDITPNRPDAFSHQGVARDIACKTNREFTQLSVTEVVSKGNDTIDISMEDPEDCPRYIGGIVKNVKVGPSPEWLVERLRSSGQRSINNIVDISNFVLMEMGHPTHIFDHESLKNKSIHVRRAKKGETLTTLDDQKHKLDETHLLITDGKEPLALAGVMGGASTSVSDKTTTLLVESAYFNPVTIRKGAKSLSMSTDASKRYERGADPNGCETAFWRVVGLLEEITGGELCSDMIDVYPNPITENKVELRRSELDLVLGINIDDKTVERILNGLGILSVKNGDDWHCQVPTYRPDIFREIDLIEEVARIYGFDDIPADESLYGSFRYDHPDPEQYLDTIRNTLSGCGFHQIYANSLQNENEATLSGQPPVKMLNPLNVEMGFLRTSLLPGLLKAADYNLKHSVYDLRLFELGHIHVQKDKGLENIVEKKYISGVVFGSARGHSVHSGSSEEDLFTLKGYLNTLFVKKLGMRMDLVKGEEPGFDHSRTIMVNRQKVGSMGRISSSWIDSMDLDLETVYGFEVDIEPIKRMINRKRTFKSINPYPKISRDLNLVMPVDQEVGDLLELFFKKGKKLVIDAKPVNIFTNEDAIGEGMKSVTFSISFQDSSKTLEDKDVNPVIDEIIHVAEKDFLAKLRT